MVAIATDKRAHPAGSSAGPSSRAVAVRRGATHHNGVSTIELLRETGHRREGTPRRGFRWRTADGRRLPARELRRVDALRLPPAWTDVHASPLPTAKVQAIGRDKAGRWQYRYHPQFVARRDAAKYRRLLRFAELLPRMRGAIDRHLALRGLPREKVLAAAVHVLMTCFMRAGSEKHMRANGSFGIATLRSRHVQVKGDVVRFDFPGKSGQRQVRELRDRRIAGIVRQLLRLPGRDLFKFEADDGLVDVRRRHINAYVREVMGGPYTAKDFRTWAGTLICACELAKRAPEMIPGRTSPKRMVSAAVKATAHALGNTPAVCRSSYINPGVLDAFERGVVVERYFATVEEMAVRRGLHGSEKALLEILASGSRTTRPSRAGRSRVVDGATVARAPPRRAARAVEPGQAVAAG
jgi:DNA topoisomerase-1